MRTLAHMHMRHEVNDLARDAARYRFLRNRPLDAVTTGGVFAGMVPENVVLNGAELDEAIDAAMRMLHMFSDTQSDWICAVTGEQRA